MVYAEIKDSAFSLNLSLTRKNCDELWSGSRMKLSAGQTAVIYGDAFYPGNDSTYKLCAVNFSECGQSNGQLRLFHLSSRYIGDSATLSVQGADASILPLQDIKQWETWYDEAKGMTPEQIFNKYPNNPKPIAMLSDDIVAHFPGVTNRSLYCGKAYFINHMVNHHAEVNPAAYEQIQDLITYGLKL